MIAKKKDLQQIHFENKVSFHLWLEKNYEKSNGIWLVFYKKHVDSVCIDYDEALEEALCFGWIDSIVKRIDNDRYVRKFTPRRNISNWSERNKKIVDKLIMEGRMQEAGLNKIDIYLKTGKVNWKESKSPELTHTQSSVPEFIHKELGKNEKAFKNFENLALSHKKNYIQWITCAKREETKLRRLKESIELLKENKKLGLK